MPSSASQIFQPFSFSNGITVRNRMVMAPMTTWSSNKDGTISEQELSWYRARANGVGMVITGCTHVQPSGIGFTNEFAAYDDRFIPSLKNLAKAAKSGGATAILQIFHAGNKAVPSLVPNGELVSASHLAAPKGAFNDGELASRALTHDEILRVIQDFGAATRHTIEAGFDGVELHGAHGFLLQNFLSPLYNQRTDQWGGSFENRMRFPLAVVAEVRSVISTYAKHPFLLGYRISPEEPGEGGLRIQEALAFSDKLIQTGDIDYLHASLYNILAGTPLDETSGKTTSQHFIDMVAGRIPLIEAGGILTLEDADKAIESGLPLVAIGRGLAINPHWVELAQTNRTTEISTELDLSRGSDTLKIPDNLWNNIQTTPGWFPVKP